MNEPLHPHFVLADGTYCHVLADRLVMAKRDLPKVMPEPTGKKLWFEVIGMTVAALIMLFFFVMMLISGYYLLGFLTIVLATFSGYTAFRLLGYTETPAILRDDILKLAYHRRSIGNDFFVVFYTDPAGKMARRRLTIYDSKESLLQALRVMKDEGFFGE
jgi:hypothetical protein